MDFHQRPSRCSRADAGCQRELNRSCNMANTILIRCMRLNYHHQGHPRLLRQYGRIIPARPQPGTTNANFLRFHKYTLLVHASGNHTAQEDLARVLYHVLESPSHLVAGDPQPWTNWPLLGCTEAGGAPKAEAYSHVAFHGCLFLKSSWAVM